MAHRLDVLMRSRKLTNEQLAKDLNYSRNYVSGVRNGLRPSLQLATALCKYFAGELTLSDLGIEIDRSIAGPSDGEDAA